MGGGRARSETIQFTDASGTRRRVGEGAKIVRLPYEDNDGRGATLVIGNVRKHQHPKHQAQIDELWRDAKAYEADGNVAARDRAYEKINHLMDDK